MKKVFGLITLMISIFILIACTPPIDNDDDDEDDPLAFRLVDFSIDSQTGLPQGTYAVRPTQIIVKTSESVINTFAFATDDETANTLMLEMISRFTIREKLNEDYVSTLIIERVDFASSNETVSDFVIVLPEISALDIEKEYVLFYDDGINDAEINVNMDKESPVISFPSLGSSKIILVQWGQEFSGGLPIYTANDNRDGNLTHKVFVPAGVNAILDTRTEADYTIMLQVEDNWGNITQETFIFRVTKNPQA